MTKINLKKYIKPHAHLKTKEKICAKFQKDRNEIVSGVAITMYPLTIHRRPENDKVHKVEKRTKNNARIISKTYAHLQAMAKTSAKFQKKFMRSCAHEVPSGYILRVKNY